MNSKLMKNSVLSIVLGGITVFSAAAFAEIGANGSATSRASTAANGTVNGNDTGTAGVSSATRAAASGNVSARIQDDAIRGSVMRNGSAAAQAGVNAAHNTAADVKKSGRVIHREAEQASGSVSVNGDVSTDDAATVETGDGVSVDVGSITGGNAGVTVKPNSGQLATEAGRLSGNAKGNFTAMTNTSVSGAQRVVRDTRGSASAGGNLKTDVSSSVGIQQDISSTVQSSVEEGIAQSRTAVDAAIDAAVEVATEAQAEANALIRQTQSLSADAAGDVDLTGEGSLGL